MNALEIFWGIFFNALFIVTGIRFYKEKRKDAFLLLLLGALGLCFVFYAYLSARCP